MACLTVQKTEAYVHDNGDPNYIYVARSWTYTVSTVSVSGSDETIYLSYAGSSVVNGTHFNAPLEVVLKAGKTSVAFEIYVIRHEGSYHQYLNVVATSESRTSCNTARNQILSKKSTPGYQSEYEGCPECDPHCCDFFDEKLDGWKVFEDKGCPDFFKDTPMLF